MEESEGDLRPASWSFSSGQSMHCIDRAGTDRAGSVHQVFIVQGPCMECSFVVAGTVQGPCIDCPELNDQLPLRPNCLLLTRTSVFSGVHQITGSI